MKTMWQELFKDELAWWKSLTARQKVYTGYFHFSLILLLGTADGNSLWVIMLVVLNFCNSARLAKRVPIDKLKEY